MADDEETEEGEEGEETGEKGERRQLRAPSLPASKARRTVLVLMAVAVGATLLRRATTPDIPRSEILRPRVLIGGLIATIFLMLTTEFAPKLAMSLAIVIAITSVVSSEEALAFLDPTAGRSVGTAGNLSIKQAAETLDKIGRS